MARPSDYRQGYRKNTRNRQKKENKFYTKPNNGGILNKRMPGIDEIKQNIEAEQARAQEYENEWLDSVVNNEDEKQTKAAKARAQEAKSSVKSWNEKLSEAYGLGEEGYWNRGTQQPITQQSEKMREHPEHAYGIGQYSPAAEQQKPAAISSAAGSAKGRQIMDLQDTLVHNPGMSAREKSQVQEKINNLTADKEVLDWKDANPGRPTQENYQTQIDYYNRLITQAQDDMVNALGSGNVSTGDDKWYEYHDKVDELVKQRDAYNRGMMGQLDGDKAQTAEEATATAGGGRSVSLDANDGAVYTGRPGVEDYKDKSQNAEKQDDYSGLTAEELNNKKQEETNNFVEENNAKREVDKQFLKEDIISRNMTMYNEAMTAAKFGDYKLLNNLKTFVYNGEPVGYVPSEQLKEDLIAYALEAEDYDQLCKDIDVQYDKAEADGIQAMDDEFDPYFERLAVTDQLGDDYTVMDWTNDSVDLSIDNSSEISGINTQVQELKNYALDLEVMDNPDKYKEIYSISADIKDLENRKKEWEQYNEKYEIAKTADLEELDALQLFMRAGYDTQAIINETNNEIEKIIPMLKQAEQGALYDGLVYFNDALKEFEEGDDARIESIFTETYGDEGKPFDTENLDIDELRDAYLKHNWDSSGLEEEFIQPLIDARDEKLAEYRETMRPYLEEQMNYEETKSGFNLEISPEMIEYTIAYAEGEKKGYTSDSNVTSASGIAGGALTAVISATGVGIAVGVVIGMIDLIASDTLNDKADQWDDLANELEHYMDTDKPLKIQVIGDKVFVDKIDEEN